MSVDDLNNHTVAQEIVYLYLSPAIKSSPSPRQHDGFLVKPVKRDALDKNSPDWGLP
jgi:hypothetical protein